MKVRNLHHALVNVAGLSISPRRTGEVDDKAWIDWLTRSSANRDIAARCLQIVDPPAQGEPVDSHAAAVDAIRQMSVANEGHWTQEGKPALAVIREITGIESLTSAQRDAAWREVQNTLPDTQPPQNGSEGNSDTAPQEPDDGP